MNHTPTPWQTGARITRIVVWPNGWNVPMCIADCHAQNAPDSEQERVANARFIVKACNCHEELLAALERLVNCPAMNEDDSDLETDIALCQARNAITKATGATHDRP